MLMSKGHVAPLCVKSVDDINYAAIQARYACSKCQFNTFMSAVACTLSSTRVQPRVVQVCSPGDTVCPLQTVGTFFASMCPLDACLVVPKDPTVLSRRSSDWYYGWIDLEFRAGERRSLVQACSSWDKGI